MSESKKDNRTKTRYIYWSLLILIAAFFTLSGYLEITKSPLTYPKTLFMGYPPFFITALGIAKICGAIVLLIPQVKRLKEWAFAGFIFDVIFAFISGIAINSPSDYIKAIIVFLILVFTFTLFVKRNKPARLIPAF